MTMIEGLDPGIRKTVEWLNECGFETTDSGDGVSKVGMECALDVPNVFMEVTPDSMVEEARRLHALLQDRGVDFGQYADASIQASFDPVDGSSILELYGVDDAMLERSHPFITTDDLHAINEVAKVLARAARALGIREMGFSTAEEDVGDITRRWARRIDGLTPAQIAELRAAADAARRLSVIDGAGSPKALAPEQLNRIEALEEALRSIADLAPECDHCTDLEEPPRPKRPITHETTLWRLPVYLCAEHAPDRVASYRKAESKGSGKQPDVVPYVEPNPAIEMARAALAKVAANG